MTRGSVENFLDLVWISAHKTPSEVGVSFQNLIVSVTRMTLSVTGLTGRTGRTGQTGRVLPGGIVDFDDPKEFDYPRLLDWTRQIQKEARP